MMPEEKQLGKYLIARFLVEDRLSTTIARGKTNVWMIENTSGQWLVCINMK